MDRLYISSIGIEKPLDRSSYLYGIPAIRQLEKQRLVFDNQVSIFIGENGTGKSTILEAMAVGSGFNAEGGTRNFRFSTNETHSPLHEYLTVAKSAHQKDGFFLRAESFYNFASNVDELDKGGGSWRIIDSYGGVSLHEQSHGESFLSLVKNRFSGKGLYILDEPEAALSPARLMQLLCYIHDLVNNDSQFIISTHSVILMSYPGASIFELSEKGINKTDYRNSEHYRITRDFIDKPEVMYRYLFEEKENLS